MSALKSEIPALRVLRHDRNQGQSRSIRTGVQAARGGIIVTLDGDGQNDPADIPRLLAALRAEDDVGLVSGVRVKRQDTASRRIASKLGNGFRNLMLGDGATDTGCGLKVFRRQLFLDLPYFDHIHRFLIALALLFVEIIKAAGTTHREIINHRLSMLTFVVALVEFIMLKGFGTSTFFLITIMCLFDVVAGYTISLVAAKRDLSMAPHEAH